MDRLASCGTLTRGPRLASSRRNHWLSKAFVADWCAQGDHCRVVAPRCRGAELAEGRSRRDCGAHRRLPRCWRSGRRTACQWPDLSPLFAPGPSPWTLTMVPSMMAYAKSAFRENAGIIRSGTPLLHVRKGCHTELFLPNREGKLRHGGPPATIHNTASRHTPQQMWPGPVSGAVATDVGAAHAHRRRQRAHAPMRRLGVAFLRRTHDQHRPAALRDHQYSARSHRDFLTRGLVHIELLQRRTVFPDRLDECWLPAHRWRWANSRPCGPCLSATGH
jgi:hypothetical protein